MKLKTLCKFENLSGLLNITSTIAKELNGASFSLGKWYDGVKDVNEEESFFNFDGMNAEDRRIVDDNIRIKEGMSDVWKYFDLEGLTTEEKKLVYNDIASLFKARESQLNRQYYSLLLKYNPIDNYDRTETQTHNESNVIGARSSSIVTGARSSSNTKGARTDLSETSESASPFDATEYSKKRNKTETSSTSGAETDTATSASATDTTSSQRAEDSNTGGYTLRARGNIGTMTTETMRSEFERNALFCFIDEILKIVENEITLMNYEI